MEAGMGIMAKVADVPALYGSTVNHGAGVPDGLESVDLQRRGTAPGLIAHGAGRNVISHHIRVTGRDQGQIAQDHQNH